MINQKQYQGSNLSGIPYSYKFWKIQIHFLQTGNVEFYWAQGIYANIYKKIDEIDKHHCKNENILQQRIVAVDQKVLEAVEKHEN